MKRTLLSIFTVALSTSLFAQVNYTDITDVVLNATATGEQLDIDIDGDGVGDIGIIALSGSGLKVSASFLADNDQSAIISVMQSGLATPTALALNAPINSTSAWIDTASAGMNSYYNAAYSDATSAVILGTCASGTDIYLGVRFLIGSDLHYGWVLINVATDASTTTVKAYGYEETADTEILAGAQPSSASINKNVLSSSVYPNPALNELNIEINEEVASINVLTLDGKVVASVNNDSKIDVSGLNSGLYIYQVITVAGNVSNGNFTKM